MSGAKFIAILCVGILIPIAALNLKPKVFKLEQMKMCQNSDSLPITIEDLDMQNPTVNKFIFNGNIILKENVTAGQGLKLIMEVNRCNLDLSNCVKYDRVVIPNLCDKINDKASFWAPMTRMIRPRMKCPISEGSYSVNNGTFDLNMVSRMPIEGYRWAVKVKVVQGNKKSERNLFCCDMDVSVTVAKKKA